MASQRFEGAELFPQNGWRQRCGHGDWYRRTILNINPRFDGFAGPEAFQPAGGFIENDLYRHTLDHFDEVTGSILRR